MVPEWRSRNVGGPRLKPAAHILVVALSAAFAAPSVAADGAGGIATGMSGFGVGGSGVAAGGSDDRGGQQGGRPAWLIEPRISVTETITDNAALSQGGGGSKGDQITQISPGIRLLGRSARLKANFDYSLNQIYYAQNTHGSSTQNALNTNGTLEALEDWMFLDFNGTISQQSISAFGTQSFNNASVNSNTTETSNYSLSPYIRGRLAGSAEYLVRYRWTTTDTKSNQVSGNSTETWTANIHGSTGLASLGWALDAISTRADYNGGRVSESDRMFGTLIWRIDPQFRLNFSAGTEADNYTTPDKETRSTHGYGFDWAPTTRTSITAYRERRAFGNSHRFSFNHRTPLSAWRFTDSRDVEVLNQTGVVGLGTIYDLVYALTASNPNIDPNDEVTRAQFTNFILAQLGLQPNAVVTSGFLASQAYLQRRRELSFTILGARNNLTFTASQSRRESLTNQTVLALVDDFRFSNVINQRSYSVNFSHRLNEDSSINAMAMKLDSSGESSSASNLHTSQKTLSVNFSTRFGPKTTASLGLRRTEFDSESTPYTENAVTGTFTARF